MACYDGLISIRGLCEVDDALYYLDDLGISLMQAAYIADEKHGSGKALILAKINQGFEETFSDIKFNGFEANKILNDSEVGVNSTDALDVFSGAKGMSFELDKFCSITRFYLHKVTLGVAVSGVTTVNLIEGTTTTQLYTGTPEVGDKEILVNSYVDDFSIEVTTAGQVYSGTPTITHEECGCRNEYFTITDDGQNYGLIVDFQVRCDKDKYLCKYVDKIAKVAQYKAFALIWNETYHSNRFNDALNIKKEKAIEMMAWADSTYNLLKYDPAADQTYKPQGMYQKEQKKLNIPAPKCKCCLECDGDNYVIVKS